MDCASVFQIPGEGYVEAIYCAEFFSDSEKIEESLRGMLDAAVAAVDDWYRRVFLSNGSTIRVRMSQNNSITIAAQRADGVLQCLSLLR